MQFVKMILLVILVATIGVAGLEVATNRGLLASNPLGGLVASAIKVATPVAQLLPTNMSEQVGVLSARTSVVSQEVGAVLGTSIQADKAETPIHEKAFEHVRYLYCQQVVKDYEARQASASASATPSSDNQ